MSIYPVVPTFMVGLRLLALVSIVIVCTASARAEKSNLYDVCSASAKTQSALTTCAAEELARAEHGLNVVYAKLTHAVAGRPEELAKIRAAERAWIDYRDLYLEAMYPAKAKQAEYGSIYPMEVDLALADLTRQQTTALAILLKADSGCGINSIVGCRKHGRP